MNIPEGSRHVVIRYADVKGFNCIEEHMKVLSRYNYVWFGKIGVKLKRIILDNLIKDKSNYLILKSPRKTYFCRFEQYREETPEDRAYPEYYLKAFEDLNNFSMWFKITEICEVKDTSILSDIYVISSRNQLTFACRGSMSAHFFTKNEKEIVLE